MNIQKVISRISHGIIILLAMNVTDKLEQNYSPKNAIKRKMIYFFFCNKVHSYSIASYTRSGDCSEFYQKAVGMINMLCRWVVFFLFFML